MPTLNITPHRICAGRGLGNTEILLPLAFTSCFQTVLCVAVWGPWGEAEGAGRAVINIMTFALEGLQVGAFTVVAPAAAAAAAAAAAGGPVMRGPMFRINPTHRDWRCCIEFELPAPSHPSHGGGGGGGSGGGGGGAGFGRRLVFRLARMEYALESVGWWWGLPDNCSPRHPKHFGTLGS